MGRLVRFSLIVCLILATGLAKLVAAVAALVLGDISSARVFVIAAMVTLVIAVMIGLVSRGDGKPVTAPRNLAALIGSFAVLPGFAAAPLLMIMPGLSVAQAYFEMLSAFTTTGASALPQTAPEAVHVWRGLTGWLGGFLTLLAGIAIMAPLRLGGFEVMSRDGPADAGRHPMAARLSSSELVGRWAIDLAPAYLALTLILLVALEANGLVGLDGLMVAMAVMSTSGIVAGDVAPEIGFVGEAFVLLFTCLAFSYPLIHRPLGLLQAGQRAALVEFRFAASLLAVTALVLMLYFMAFVAEGVGLGDLIRALWAILVTLASYLSTTGFAAGGWEGLGVPGIALLCVALIGGGIATTAGGLKLMRVIALYQHASREMQILVHPSSVGGGAAGGRHVRREGAYIAWMFVMLFFVAIAGGGLGLSLSGLDFETALVLAFAALTNCGPLAGTAASEPIMLAESGSGALWVMSVLMLIGRVEALAVVALINPEYWRR